LREYVHREGLDDLSPWQEQLLMTENKLEIWTIGHSTRPIEELIAALRSFEINVLVDVRSFPGSKRYPQFNKENLKASLTEAAIDYQHFRELGGRRRARPDSLNIAWRNESFRGYADYMDTEDFRRGITRLLDVARTHRTAVMCSEAVWWRCHRSMISDYLKAKGSEVNHIMQTGKSEPHPFTSAARIVNGELSYRGVFAGES
jgi:uncharacterized protein (DUF488 family)